jgi:hypothetical protein
MAGPLMISFMYWLLVQENKPLETIYYILMDFV